MRFLTGFCLIGVLPLIAATLEVGPGKRFAKPCAAFAVAANGDDIEIDASGDYTRDVCSIGRSNLYIRGVNGRPVIDGQGTVSGGKGLWNIQGNDLIVDNIEFTNAKSADRNGAGIRHEGRNIRIRRCYFHDNEDGILATSNADSETIVELSEFENNGTPEGLAHNIYVTTGARLIFRFNYSHRSIGGHLLKSRLKENLILYNRLTQEDGTGSYEVDLPNQGKVWLVGNVIQQGASSQNQNMISYGTEVRDGFPGSFLYAFHNTIVNETTDPAVGTEKFLVAPGVQKFPIVFGNNIIFGRGDFTASATPVLLQNLITQDDPMFLNPAAFDYRLRDGSPAIDLGSGDYPAEAGDLVKPLYENLPRVCGKDRRIDANPDFGAFEFDPQLPDPNADCDATRIPQPGIKVIMNSAATLIGGASGSGRVILNQAAPANGKAISLGSSSPGDVVLPQSISIPEGAVSASFSFTTRVMTAPLAATITAAVDGISDSVDLTITPIGADVLRLEPPSIGGGATNGIGRVILNGPAPNGGFVVTLSSADPTIVQVPTQMTVGQGATQGTFPIKTFPVDQDTPVVITATSAAGPRTATLTVQAVGVLNIAPAATRFGGGSPVNLRVNFNGPTSATAANILTFESSKPDVIPVPDPLTVLPGVTFTTASLRSNAVGSTTAVILTAVFGSSRQSVTFTVDPPALGSITSTLTTFGSGGSIRLTASLNAPLSSATPLQIALTSDNPQLLHIPDSVSISPGATSVSFDAQTEAVTVRTKVTVIAASAGLGRTLTLTFDPMALTGLTCPTSSKGGSTPFTCKPTINGPAPVSGGGAQIDLSTNSPALAAVPASAIIPTGTTTTSFQVQTRAVTFSTPISITGTYKGTTRTVNVTLTP